MATLDIDDSDHEAAGTIAVEKEITETLTDADDAGQTGAGAANSVANNVENTKASKVRVPVEVHFLANGEHVAEYEAFESFVLSVV